MSDIYVDNVKISGDKLELVSEKILEVLKENKVSVLEYEYLKDAIDIEVKKRATL